MPDELDAYRMKYDEQGRPYFEFPGQPRNYVSPASFGKPIGGNPESAWHSGPQWNQYSGQAENPFKWGKLLTVGTAGALGLGALDAAGVLGGAGGPAMYGPPASLAADAAPVATGGAASLLQKLLSGKGLAGLATLIPMLLSAKGNSTPPGGGGLDSTLQQNPQLASLLNMSVNRAQRTDPLHQAVTQLAMSRLPTNVQR